MGQPRAGARTVLVDSVYVIVDTVYVPAQLTSPEQLVTAARAVLERDGLEGLTLRAVARQAGVSHGAPLRHFPGVATLLAALAAQGFEQLYDSVDAAVRDVTDPRQRLAAGGRGYIRFALAHPGVFSLMFRNELIDTSYPPLGEKGSRAFLQLVDLVEASAPVLVQVTGGRSVRGTAAGVGRDFLVVRGAGGAVVLVPFASVASVRPLGGTVGP